MPPTGKRKSANHKSPDPVHRLPTTDIVGILLCGVALVLGGALLGYGPGAVSSTMADVARLLFGWGAYALVALLLLAGLLLLRTHSRHIPFSEIAWSRVLAGELAFLGFLTLLHLLYVARGGTPTVPSSGQGGGIVGWMLGEIVRRRVSTPVAWLVFTLVTSLSALAAAGASAATLRERLATARERLEVLGRAWQSPPSAPLPPEPAPTPKAAKKRKAAKKPGRKPSQPPPDTAASSSSARSQARSPSPPVRKKRGVHLPPLDLLHPAEEQGLDLIAAREQARLIEETLAAFGIPAQVVEINQGPTVTRFGVKPGFIEKRLSDGTIKRTKVKVSKITSLANDLALALAARSIRIEAPVPGQPYIGIEVPNTEANIVSLRGLLESKEFKALEGELRIALGRDVSGRPVVTDLARLPHLLIAGATGSGKSVCINAIIACLLLNLTPAELRLVMIDPKMVELISYNGIPHLIAPVVTDVEEVIGVLTWATREMDRRYKLFSQRAKRHIQAYNAWAAAQGEPQLPYIVIVIDELADLMMVAPDEVERLICRLAQMARATGIHLIVATQRPSVDVVTGLIKANFPARIAFAVASSIDSRVILDQPGAEALLGRGDMLYMAPDASQLQRLQGAFVSDAEINAIVTWWRLNAETLPRSPEDLLPWDEFMEQRALEAEDELLPDAIELVRQYQYASISFLQRKLRIGYSRAARLMELLEAQGIVGPPEEGSGSRPVLIGREPSPSGEQPEADEVVKNEGKDNEVTYEADDEIRQDFPDEE